MEGNDALIFLIFFGLFFLVLGALIGTVFGVVILTVPHNVIEKHYCFNHPELENTTRCIRY